MSNVLEFQKDKQKDPNKSYRVFTGKLQDSLLCWFEVEVSYYQFTNGEVSIESYELEGDNIDRDELVDRFGEHTVNLLEEQLDGNTNT